MQPTNELILKFFKRECTPEEAERVHEYLTANPNILDKYLDEQEWIDILHYQSPDEERSNKILEAVLNQIDHGPAARVFRIKPWLISSVAACICIALTIVIALNTKHQPNNTNKLAAVDHPALFKWQTAVNQNSKALSISLEDGSRVVLAAKSSIRYKLPFQNKLRDIYLKGQAKFYVAKDKTRPFTVYAGPLATTALGTVFKITSWPGSTSTRVRLLSGKVKVVQHQHTNSSAVYLTPGKELVFDHVSHTTAVNLFKPQVSNGLQTVDAGSTTVRGDTINFVNQQLPQVIVKLQEVYGVNITATANLKKYYFTGDFNIHTESVSSILNTITSLNKLKAVTKDSVTYIITKP